MDLADQIVVMSHGRVEQAGGPRELYDDPANEFVMTFVGEVNRVGSSFVRPHDVEFGAGDEALVERVVHLGFEVRVELRLANGEELWAQTTRDEAQRLELVEGSHVRVRPRVARVFR
jgi:sulfate transport system ATP-binding protein